MITDRLRAVLDNAADYPPETQDQLAVQIDAWLDELDDALWERHFSDLRSEAVFAEMVAAAQQRPFLPFPTPRDMGDEKSAHAPNENEDEEHP